MKEKVMKYTSCEGRRGGALGGEGQAGGRKVEESSGEVSQTEV